MAPPFSPLRPASAAREAHFHRLLDAPERRIASSRAIVIAKIGNGVRLLRGHARNHPNPKLTQTCDILEEAKERIASTGDIKQLMGMEGAAAATYFQGFAECFRGSIVFTHRNRHPPLDPANSLLSFGYTLLLRHIQSYLTARGLDANVSVFHEPGRGHPALASDLIEEFRAPIVDALVLAVTNRNQFAPEDFCRGEGDPQPCLLRDDVRPRFIEAFENKLAETLHHPDVTHNVEWRQTLDLQASRMRRFVLGEVDHYHPFEWVP